ncbi:MAG: GNAT family N-acetyltransferase [Mahellales bacterium]|jgi:ribosomal protein S18 acetylase RimI-like enzyme
MVRFALVEDGREVAELIYIIIESMDIPLFNSASKEQVIDFIVHAFHEKGNRFSRHNIIVKEIDNHIAGMAVAYSGKDAPALDRNLYRILQKFFPNRSIVIDKEAGENEFYVDSLCVFPDYRGRGVGTQLLKWLEDMAFNKGFTKISLNVECGNLKALELYRFIGYRIEKEITIAGHGYFHMVKKPEAKQDHPVPVE